LVVEDERKIALFVQRGLKESGFVVDVVHDGDQALAVILDSHFEAVVLHAQEEQKTLNFSSPTKKLRTTADSWSTKP
jgi:DNA-binding response OmpR family regulator